MTGRRAVKPRELRTPEDGLVLENRDATPAAEAPAGLMAGLARARALPIPQQQSGCRSCWDKGREAAIAAVANGGGTLEQRAAGARSLEPVERHTIQSWLQGRDAALRAIEAE